MTVDMLTLALLTAAIWSLFCRVYAMEWGVTRLSVIVATFVLLSALFAALLLPTTIAKAALAAGVFLYLLADAKRWRGGPPPETRKQEAQPPDAPPPQPMPPGALRHVGGGSKDESRVADR